MSYDLKAFYQDNKLPETQVEFLVTDKFVDKDGKPIPWLIRAISAEEDQKIKDQFTEVTTDRRTGVRSESFDQNSYIIGLAAKGVAEPDLTDRNLQKSYGVTNSFYLLQKMLSAGELQRLALKVIEVSGLDDLEGSANDFEFDYATAMES